MKKDSQNNLFIEIDNINNLLYLDTIPVLLESLIRITQNINTTDVPYKYINLLCQKSEEHLRCN